MADDEYDEVEAVVRIPKGQRLVDSQRTEGWSRGFTPKSAAKGPEHVEIRLKGPGDAEPEPAMIFVTEYVETPQQREPTLAQQMAAVLLAQAIETAKPHVIEWWNTRALPAVVAKRDGFLQRRHARKAEKKVLLAETETTAPASGESVQEEMSSQQLAAAEDSTIRMTSEQFRQIFVTWLAGEDAQRVLWHTILNAEIRDDDVVTLEWRQRLTELTPEQRTECVEEFLFANPSFLSDLGRSRPHDPQRLGRTIDPQGDER